MNNKKAISLIAAASMILLTIAATFSGLQIFTVNVVYASLDLRHSATVSPSSTILSTLPATVTYWVNVTSLGADYLNQTCIKLPTGWTNATDITTPPTNWVITTDGSDGWLNFTTTTDAYGAPANFTNSATYNFSIPVKISMVPPTTATWSVYCYQGTNPSTTNPVSVTVTVNLQFHSTMSPSYVANGTSYIYTLITTNDACGIGINKINITFPAGTWSFNVLIAYVPDTWTVSYDNVSTFMLSGPSIVIGKSTSIMVNMTTPVAPAGTGEYYWNCSAWNSLAPPQPLGTYSIKAVVDSSKPTVTFDAPIGNNYSVGSGNYTWINATVTDYPSIEKYYTGYTISINDTRFQLQSSEEVNENTYHYFFVNNTAIPDGPLAVKITATDPAGNIGTAEISTTVDNTAPEPLWIKVLDQTGAELPRVGEIFWMGATTTGIQVNASFYNPSGFTGTIYLNSTSGPFTNNTLWPPTSFDVTGSDYVTLNITLTDLASPTANKFTHLWEIKRDKVKPSAPTFTPEAICGGIVIRQITATDNVGVLKYKIYINGNDSEVLLTDLNSTTLNWLTTVPFAGNNSLAFSGALVLNLTVYAGQTVNLTICTVDYGANPSDPTTYILSIPKERWYPIELQKDWNLISLPLVPANSTIENVLSLLLKQGLLQSVWHYDAETKTWHSYAPGAPPDLTTMVDGGGYFVKVTDYNVLIVQGTIQPLPPASPRVYDVVRGWNLIGYKEIYSENVSTYLSGVDCIRVYSFNASTQAYEVLKPSDNMTPGLGYWVAVKTEGSIYP